MRKLEGKVALITGGNSGIGLASAKAFAREGAHVVITGRRQDALDDALKEIGSGAAGIQGDVSNLSDLDRLYKELAERFGKIRDGSCVQYAAARGQSGGARWRAGAGLERALRCGGQPRQRPQAPCRLALSLPVYDCGRVVVQDKRTRPYVFKLCLEFTAQRTST